MGSAPPDRRTRRLGALPIGRPAPPSIPSLVPWLVHGLTASGAVIAVPALLAAERGDGVATLTWLALALLIDAVDGPLARWADVESRLPRMDGTTLDLVVDYLTYVFVPTILICRTGAVAVEAVPAVATLIQLSALYHYARTDLKTGDNFFVGFPALWNVVAFYLWAIAGGPWFGVAVVCACAAATVLPIYFVHPIRVRAFQPWTRIIAAVWCAASAALLWARWGSAGPLVCLSASLGSAAALTAVGLLRTFRPGAANRPDAAKGEPV